MEASEYSICTWAFRCARMLALDWSHSIFSVVAKHISHRFKYPHHPEMVKYFRRVKHSRVRGGSILKGPLARAFDLMNKFNLIYTHLRLGITRIKRVVFRATIRKHSALLKMYRKRGTLQNVMEYIRLKRASWSYGWLLVLGTEAASFSFRYMAIWSCWCSSWGMSAGFTPFVFRNCLSCPYSALFTFSSSIILCDETISALVLRLLNESFIIWCALPLCTIKWAKPAYLTTAGLSAAFRRTPAGD